MGDPASIPTIAPRPGPEEIAGPEATSRLADQEPGPPPRDEAREPRAGAPPPVDGIDTGKD